MKYGFVRFAVSALVISAIGVGVVGQVAVARPIFVGGASQKFAESRAKKMPLFGLFYMTAEQMAEKVAFLTGFYQSGFAEFGSIIGRLDPRTGVRTNDRPTVISVMIIEQLVNEVAESVLAREQFLDDEDRIVFKGLHLERSPDGATLAQFTLETCSDWLLQRCPLDIENGLIEDFRATERSAGGLEKAWTELIGSLLQNGTLYYY